MEEYYSIIDRSCWYRDSWETLLFKYIFAMLITKKTEDREVENPDEQTQIEYKN